MKVVSHNLWLLLRASQAGSHGADHRLLLLQPLATDRVALDVLVEQFVGIPLGAVARQVEQPKFLRVTGHPGAITSGGIG